MCASEPSAHPRNILQAHGLRARRRLGQNFLVSPEVMGRIVEAAGIEPDDVVLEIGTGLGRLTALLAGHASAVVGVEIDRGLYKIADERLAELANVTLVCGDFLASKHQISPAVSEAVLAAAQGRPVKVVSNLPYQISSPAIIDLLEWEIPVREIDVMLQSEVAGRLTSAPGKAAYGPLSVFATYRAEIEKLFSLPPSAFWPRPAVCSSFVRIVPRPPRPEAKSYAMFSEVVNKLLQNRRKTLSRALTLGWGRSKALAVLERLRLAPALRPGRLAVADFVHIADVLAALPADGVR